MRILLGIRVRREHGALSVMISEEILDERRKFYERWEREEWGISELEIGGARKCHPHRDDVIAVGKLTVVCRGLSFGEPSWLNSLAYEWMERVEDGNDLAAGLLILG